jgi:hypothetical protein
MHLSYQAIVSVARLQGEKHYAKGISESHLESIVFQVRATKNHFNLM